MHHHVPSPPIDWTTALSAAQRRCMHGAFSRSREPVATAQSGDRISFSTPDVSWGLAPPVDVVSPRRKAEPREAGPCMCGPVAIRGAMPGDTLEIAIERVTPCGWGWTYAGQGMVNAAYNAALGVGEAPLTLVRWNLDEERVWAVSDAGDRVRVRAFPGVIGLCPDEDEASGWTPKNCGGNMDCRELVAGSTLLLPVMVAGGMLSVGDGHAAQGDGEVSGTAIECGMEEVRVRVSVRKDVRVTRPRVRRADGTWVTLGFGETLDAAAREALNEMLDVMEAELGRGRAAVLGLASSCVDVRVTQMVNPRVGMQAVWRRGESWE